MSRRHGTIRIGFGHCCILVLLLPVIPGLVFLSGCMKGDATTGGGTQAGAKTIPVVLTPVQTRTFEQRLTVQGNVEAKNKAVVTPRIGGPITEFYVDEGDTVEAGKTKLFQIDSLRVEKALEISKQDLALAQCGQREAQANLERMQADFDKAEIDFKRFKRLREQNAVTPDAMEQQESRYKQTAAGLKYAKTMEDVAKERVTQAKAALKIAERNLSDSLIYAPISGKISHRFQEPGESVDPNKPMVRIVDLSLLEISAFLPAQQYDSVDVSETQARIVVNGTDTGMHTIVYKSPTIEPTLRTFEIKCEISDPPEGVVPGAMADIYLLLETRQGLGVPTPAVVPRDGKQVVFIVEHNTAKKVEVETGLESDGWIEVLNGLTEGIPVITMGQHLVDEGTSVVQQKEGA
ncbi:MAG TPA: efflux RND transporter periplasmic adaptor subunit [Candidatus Hydrogenedentes bacterium]|nr:efflux RND transporter periplasmic adaptor subunit [Candidatus Hydrogenedentota bacterium]